MHFFVLLVLCKWSHIRPLVSMYAYIVLLIELQYDGNHGNHILY